MREEKTQFISSSRHSYGNMLNLFFKRFFSHRKISRMKIPDPEFLTVKDQFGYSEEYITIKSKNKKESSIYNYSLSNNLEDIEIAVLLRTGQKISLNSASWKSNNELSLNVKHLMKKHDVIYSMTTWEEKKTRHITINMHVNDMWFTTFFSEMRGSFVNIEYIMAFNRIKNYIIKFLSEEMDDDE